MSDTIYTSPGETFYSSLDNAETGLVGTVGVRVIRNSDEATVTARTTKGIVEAPEGSGRYVATLTAPDEKGEYTVFWDTGEVAPSSSASDELVVNASGAPEVSTGPLYATAGDLRAFLNLTAEVLPDADAEKLLSEACDLIDERLGNRCPDETTGRKVTSEDFDELEAWRLRKLAEATVEVAANLFRDPGVASRQRWRSLSGDVATGSPYGPAYGERAQALINQSGLAVPFARVGRRRSRAAEVASNFFSRRP